MTDWQGVLHDPVLQLRGRGLDLLELLLGGLYAPAAGYCLPGRKPADWPVEPVLSVPAATAQAARAQGALLLADPDGTPLARLAVDGTAGGPAARMYLCGTLTPLQPAEHPPFRRLRLTGPLASSGIPAPERPPLVVAAFAAVPSLEQLARAVVSARSGRLVLLAVADGSRAKLKGMAQLVESLEAVAAQVPGGEVRLLIVPADGPPDGQGGSPERAGSDRRTGAAAAPAGSRERESARFLLQRLGADTLLDFTDAPQGTSTADTGAGRAPAQAAPHRRGLVILFTGLSGSGKSTLARELAERLRQVDGRHAALLDGDDVRTLLSSGLGFSRADRDLNVRRIGWVASLVAEAGGIALCAPIAPFESSRRDVRAMASASSDFLLVHVSTPLAVCEERDRKGLYAKARAGLIPDFTGVSSPYEHPSDADYVINLAEVSAAEGAEELLEAVRRLD